MARPLQRGEQPDAAPNQQFPGTGQSQFSSSHYPYSSSEYPSLGQDLTMTDSYTQSGPQHIVSQLQEASSITSAPSNGDIQALSVNTNGNGPPGMAPPQTPQHTGFTSPQQRESIDEASDPAATGEGSKRKRSKVSRACDECRRKKIKCDAAAEDGTIKTCTNCTKAGLTCEYSRIPMKRGPSKGYIKELSERVQQVESLQAAMSGPGYRQSLDAASNPGFAEPYSPEDPMSAKRNYSFPDTRNPFASSDFQRDRIPSGTWGPSSPLGQSFRARDRASLAIAPDQQLPPVTYPETSKPHWLDNLEEPPRKRRKMDLDDLGSLTIASSHLSNYYQTIQPNLPLLPDLDTTISILQTATPLIQHIFAIAIDLVPTAAVVSHASQNGEKMEILRPSSSAFANPEKLGDAVSHCSMISPKEQSDSDNLVLLWSYVLLAVYAEYNMAPNREATLSRRNLLKQAIDTATFLKESDPEEKNKPSSVDRETFHRTVERSWEMSVMLAKFNSLACGLQDFVRLSEYSVHTDAAESLPDVAAFLTRCSNSLANVIVQVQDGGMAQSRGMIVSKNLTLYTHLETDIAQTRGVDKKTPLVRQVKAYFELLLSRYNYSQLPMNIVHPAVSLAEALTNPTPTASTFAIYNPIEMHLFTLVTITLLEVLCSVHDPDICNLAEAVLNNVQPLIEQKAEQHKLGRSEAEKAFWKSENAEESSKIMSWAEVLMKMIDDGRKKDWPGKKASDANGSTGGVTSSPASNLSVDFGLLLKYGYANVLGRYKV